MNVPEKLRVEDVSRGNLYAAVLNNRYLLNEIIDYLKAEEERRASISVHLLASLARISELENKLNGGR